MLINRRGSALKPVPYITLHLNRAGGDSDVKLRSVNSAQLSTRAPTFMHNQRELNSTPSTPKRI